MKKIIYGILAFANAIAGLAFLLVGYSDRLNPLDYPLLACAGLFFPFFLAAVVAFMIFWIFVSPKYVLISVVALIIGYSPTRAYTPLNIANADDTGDELKIISYNVDNFNMDTLYTPPQQIVEYLGNSDADIVCLQEARLNDALKENLHKYYTYIDHYDSAGSSASGTGLVLLSKHKILKCEPIHYISESNASACWYIKYKQNTLRVISNHLESTKIPTEDRKEFKSMVKGAIKDQHKRAESKQLIRTLSNAMIKRAPQVDALAEFIGENSRNTFFVGDMNDTPISYAHHTIEQVLNDCYKQAGNLWGFSYKRDGMFVRIDHSFCSSDWTAKQCFIDQEISLSDHYPIVTYLKKELKK